MTTVLQGKDNANIAVLYMAMELSNRIWKLGFSNGAKSRQVSIDSGDLISLNEAIHQAKCEYSTG